MEVIIKENYKSELFINIFQNIKLFCDSFNIEFQKDALYIQGMDPSHISIFEILINKEWFDSYQMDDTVLIGLTATIFPKILLTWTNDHTIKLNVSEDAHLNISFEKFTGNSEYNKYFQIPLIDIESDRMSIPEQEYTLDIEFDSKKLKKLIDELSMIGDMMNIVCDEKEINATSKSIEGSMTVNIPFDDIEAYSIEENKTISATFSLRYIKNMCVFNKIATTATLHLSDGLPLQFKYELENNSYVRFYVAPTIDDN